MRYQNSSYPANWLDADDVDQLMHFFYTASFDVARRMARNPGIGEDTLTDLLIDSLSGNHIKLRSDEFPGLGLNKTVFRFIARPIEPKTGADIGVVLTTRNYDLTVTRSILIQCKKLRYREPDCAMTNYTCLGSPEYSNTLFGKRSERQATQLLSLTPSCFFLVYNPPLPAWRELAVAEIDRRTKRLAYFANLDKEIQTHASRQELDGALRWFEGPVILPATSVMGCFSSAESRARAESASRSGIGRTLRYGLPLYDFMVNDFLQGKVGDARESVQAAAAGERRSVFHPRYTLYFEIIDHF